MENQVFTLSGSYHDKSTLGICKVLIVLNLKLFKDYVVANVDNNTFRKCIQVARGKIATVKWKSPATK